MSEEKETPKSSKRTSRKRKMEEKDSVINQSIVEEVQSITEREPVLDGKLKKADSKDVIEKPKAKKARKSVSAAGDEDNENMPKGWIRKSVVRKSGKTAGQVDIYIYSPDGIKFRSRPDLAAYLAKTKSTLKPENFNFSKKVVSSNSTVSPRKDKSTSTKPKSAMEEVEEKEPPKKPSKIVVKVDFSPKKKMKRSVLSSVSRPAKPVKTLGKKPDASSKANKTKIENPEISEEKKIPKSSRRISRKRKVEEKDNVINQSIVEEVQSITEREPVLDVKSEKSKSQGVIEKLKSKKARKSASAVGDEDNENLPKGWVRKSVIRKSGKSADQVDIYIYSPDGIKFRSRPDIAAYLAKTKSTLKAEDFNFSKKIVSSNSTSTLRKGKTTSTKPKSTTEETQRKGSATPKEQSKIRGKVDFSPKKKMKRHMLSSVSRSAKPVKTSGRKSGVSSKASKKKKNA